MFNFFSLFFLEQPVLLLPKKRFRLLQQSPNQLPVVMIKSDSESQESGIIKLTDIGDRHYHVTPNESATLLANTSKGEVHLQPPSSHQSQAGNTIAGLPALFGSSMTTVDNEPVTTATDSSPPNLTT